MRRLQKALLILTVNVGLTLLLVEIVLRVYGAVMGHNLLTHDVIDVYRFEPNRNYGRLWTNSYGFASREFEPGRRPGMTRLALLGDSFAVGSVRQDDNFASWLERLRPNLEVYNFGVSAIGPKAYAAILEDEAIRFKPDLVLVGFFVGNDPTEEPGEPRSWTPVLPRFTKRVWRLGREWFRVRLESPAPLALPQLAHPSVRQKGFNLSRTTYLQVEAERLAVSRRSHAAAMAPFWAGAFAQVRRMRDTARRHQARFAMFIIPDEFQVNAQLLADVLEYVKVPRDDVDLALPQLKVREFCASESIPCLDLLPIFAGKPGTYLPQDTHWNEEGNRLAGQALDAWLAESGLLTAPSD